TRRMPWLARFGAMPEIIEKAEGLYREAARNTLSHLEEGNEALANLLLHLDNDFQRAKQLISQMLATRDHWLRHIGIPREELEDSLQRIILNELEQLRGAFDNDAAVDILPEARLEDLDNWREVADLLITQKGTLRKRVDARCERLFASLRGEDTLIERLARVRKLPPRQFTEPQWQAVQAA